MQQPEEAQYQANQQAEQCRRHVRPQGTSCEKRPDGGAATACHSWAGLLISPTD